MTHNFASYAVSVAAVAQNSTGQFFDWVARTWGTPTKNCLLAVAPTQLLLSLNLGFGLQSVTFLTPAANFPDGKYEFALLDMDAPSNGAPISTWWAWLTGGLEAPPIMPTTGTINGTVTFTVTGGSH